MVTCPMFNGNIFYLCSELFFSSYAQSYGVTMTLDADPNVNSSKVFLSYNVYRQKDRYRNTNKNM